MDEFWDGIYENNDEAENDLSSLSFEERILSLHVKNREKSSAHKKMLKKTIDTLRKNTAHVSKLSSLFRIDRNGVDQLVDEMFLVEVPAKLHSYSKKELRGIFILSKLADLFL